MSPPSPPQENRGRSSPHLEITSQNQQHHNEGTHPREQREQPQQHQEKQVEPQQQHRYQQHHHHLIDINDYDWMGVFAQSVFGDDVIVAPSNNNDDEDNEGREEDVAAVHSDADAVASDFAPVAAVTAYSSASSFPARRSLDVVVGGETTTAPPSSGAATTPDGINDDNDNDDAKKSRVERKRSRERRRRLDTNCQLAALADLVRDIDATDLAEEEAMALAYSYTRKARRWKEHSAGDVRGEEDDDDVGMMVMMSVMDKSPNIGGGDFSVGMMKMGGERGAIGAAPSSSADTITGEEKATKKMKSLDKDAINSGVNDDKGIPTPPSVANLPSVSAAASNNRIDLIARTIVQLKKLRQLRRVRNEELRNIRNRHCELRKDCEGLRKVVAHYKAVGMGVAGGYGGVHAQQQHMIMSHMQPSEKVMMMVPMMVSPQDALMQMSASRPSHQHHHAVPPATATTPTVGNLHHHYSSMKADPSTSLWINSNSSNNNGPAGYPPPPVMHHHGQHQQQSAIHPGSYNHPLSANAMPSSFQEQKHHHQQQHPVSVEMLPPQNATHQLPASETPNEGGGNVSNKSPPLGTARADYLEQVQTQATHLVSTTGTALTGPTPVEGGGVAGYHPPQMAHGGNLAMMEHPLPPHHPTHAGIASELAPVIMSMYPQINNNFIPISNNVSMYELNHPLSQYANAIGATEVLQHTPYPHHGATSAAHANHYDPRHPNVTTTYYHPQCGHVPPSTGTTMMYNPHQQHRAIAVDPNSNNMSHVNFCRDNPDTAFVHYQMPQHPQLQHTDSGGDNNQPMMIPPDKRPAATTTTTTTTTGTSQGGGGNLAHCA
ncbi:hypothetical protein ACHAXA_002917 [Cyclostephanos tholiformis]|uniref:Uncharacterized protein n=1 Tax=Cyclostephanos tholiformis TaxID=382380 RepID=A0ABD3SGP1_9STRA